MIGVDDRNIWQQFKSFSWWFFTLISAFPYFAVQPIYYTVHFLLLDKRDEYQLGKFILSFKTF